MNTDRADDPIAFLCRLERFGIKLGLDNINHILNTLGRPERACPMVHVAGTNGKGSVLAFLDAILRAAGYKTGRFTSPHLIDLTERFLINGYPITQEELRTCIADLRPVFEGMSGLPTFFEATTAIAFRCFQQHRVDMGLIEVGMGGRLDSTNVVAPVVCGITSIDLEHTQYLGDTLEKIAAEKAGIIKPGVTVVLGDDTPAVVETVARRAASLSAPLRVVNRDFSFAVAGHPLAPRFDYDGPRLQLRDVRIGLPGHYQGANAAVAVALAEQLAPDYDRIAADVVRTGLEAARWPCRLEQVLSAPPVFVDVAHNAAGAARLAEAMDPCIICLAVSADKDVGAILESLDRIAEHYILTQFDNPRALELESLCSAAGDRSFEREKTVAGAIARGMACAVERKLPLLVAGSVFLAGEARGILSKTYGAPPIHF